MQRYNDPDGIRDGSMIHKSNNSKDRSKAYWVCILNSKRVTDESD